MAPAMTRIGHYFTAFQTHVISQAEIAMSRFSMEQALLILEREAKYKSQNPTLAGLFIFQFESLSRNRLGYTRGLAAMAEDPFYPRNGRTTSSPSGPAWGTSILPTDLRPLPVLRARTPETNPEFEPKHPTLFGEKEGKIARANRGRDPMYLFSVLQRQLGYPEVPRPRRPDELEARVLLLEQKIAQLENRLKLAESEIGQDVDLAQVMVKPEDTAGVPSGWGKKGGP